MSVQFKTVDEFAVGQRLDNYLLKHLKGVPKSHIYRVIRNITPFSACSSRIIVMVSALAFRVWIIIGLPD
jgi:hypothetical protein